MLTCPEPVLQKIITRLKALDYTGYAEQYPPFGSWGDVSLTRVRLAALWAGSLALCPRAGLYVNIPFCKTKCDFCFLPVIASGPDPAAVRKLFAEYFSLLAREAGLFSKVFKSTRFSTLYIGGGTPSLMTPAEIAGLFSLLRANFSFAPGAQITTEMHPETATPETLAAFREGGVNWLCIGAQSLNGTVLSRARRSQDLGSVAEAYRNARRAGIKGINIDLICGLPGQDGRSFLSDVKTVAALRPDEIHLNTFIVTPFTLYGRRGGLPADKEATERLKERGFAYLAGRGYRRLHYDSAGLDKNSKNLQTSDLKEKRSVLGLGPGAVSRAWGAARYINGVAWKGYRAALLKRRPPVDKGCLTGVEDEMAYYALETMSNEPRKLNEADFKKVFGKDFSAVFAAELDALCAAGVKRGGGVIRASATSWNLLRRVFYKSRMLLNLRRDGNVA